MRSVGTSNQVPERLLWHQGTGARRFGSVASLEAFGSLSQNPGESALTSAWMRLARKAYARITAYSRGKDADYPPGAQYVDKFPLLTPVRRYAIAAHYALMHLIDDYADDISKTKDERRESLSFLRQKIQEAHFSRAGHEDFANVLTKVVGGYRQSKGIGISSILLLADVLDEMNDWPDAPHFADIEEAYEYESRLFKAVSLCISPVLFSGFVMDSASYNELVGGFTNFMLGMQAINVLMDRYNCQGGPGEDELAGHFWLPQSEETNPDKEKSFNRVYQRGLDSFTQAWDIFRKYELPNDVITYLKGMEDIFHTLIPVARNRWALKAIDCK